MQEFYGRGVKEGNTTAIKEVMCALQEIALAGSPGEPHKCCQGLSFRLWEAVISGLIHNARYEVVGNGF